MTEKLYSKNSYIKVFEACISGCKPFGDNYGIILDKTAFFPESGGQYADKGKINGSEVLDVREENGEIYHIMSEKLEIGAQIIGRDSSNWFATFTINKGSEDGVKINCNVMAGSGLVGRVTDVGPNYAKVTSIIEDNNNTSGQLLSTGDHLIVTGDLTTMSQGMISFSKLVDNNNKVAVGDKIVTSNISSHYLPGILIGYINHIETDSNNLTKSGTLTTAVDFEHLEDVLVIMELKQTAN